MPPRTPSSSSAPRRPRDSAREPTCALPPGPERAAVSCRLHALSGRMTSSDAIIVAALGGAAVGGGAQLAIAADLRAASPGAPVLTAGPGHGLGVAAWGLPSLVGRGRAVDLCLTMRHVDASEALRIG